LSVFVKENAEKSKYYLKKGLTVFLAGKNSTGCKNMNYSRPGLVHPRHEGEYKPGSKILPFRYLYGNIKTMSYLPLADPLGRTDYSPAFQAGLCFSPFLNKPQTSKIYWRG